MLRNETFMPGTVGDSCKNAQYTFYRDCEANVPVALPLEYRKRNDASAQAGVSGSLGERGLLIYSIFEDLCIGQELKILVFFPNGYKLDSIKLIAAVTWKRAHSEVDWKGYKYGLKVIHISRLDREKLNLLLCNEMADHKSRGESDPGWSASA